jgi:hypothetical protein|mmetsp:Transcript_7215/g.15936  ORF Transcript_7215/g.15936 Transcript_7215/m.15936 type:complete len:81 (+) Transcript_7215:42-284(+)|eukprot:scaffold4931_cov196-Alexandrium_tamarense.AAC.3
MSHNHVDLSVGENAKLCIAYATQQVFCPYDGVSKALFRDNIVSVFIGQIENPLFNSIEVELNLAQASHRTHLALFPSNTM